MKALQHFRCTGRIGCRIKVGRGESTVRLWFLPHLPAMSLFAWLSRITVSPPLPTVTVYAIFQTILMALAGFL
jgi:hypothetical protein